MTFIDCSIYGLGMTNNLTFLQSNHFAVLAIHLWWISSVVVEYCLFVSFLVFTLFSHLMLCYCMSYVFVDLCFLRWFPQDLGWIFRHSWSFPINVVLLSCLLTLAFQSFSTRIGIYINSIFWNCVSKISQFITSELELWWVQLHSIFSCFLQALSQSFVVLIVIFPPNQKVAYISFNMLISVSISFIASNSWLILFCSILITLIQSKFDDFFHSWYHVINPVMMWVNSLI